MLFRDKINGIVISVNLSVHVWVRGKKTPRQMAKALANSLTILYFVHAAFNWLTSAMKSCTPVTATVRVRAYM